MIRTEDRHRRGRPLGETVPDLNCVIRWQQRIEQPPFAARVYADAGHHLLPVLVRVPRGVLEPPDPKTRREIDDIHVRHYSLSHGPEMTVHRGGGFLQTLLYSLPRTVARNGLTSFVCSLQ